MLWPGTHQARVGVTRLGTDMWVDMDIDMDIVFGTAVCECAGQGHGYVRVFSLSVTRWRCT